MKRVAPCTIALLLTMLARAEPPTTQPSTTQPSPATEPSIAPQPALAAQIAALGDRDPLVRQTAREALMALGKTELPRLRDAAVDARPLRPTQRALLREIVIHVFLTGNHNFQGSGPGYVGVKTASVTNSTVIRDCIIGFDAYRVLRPGDVIVAVAAPEGAAEPKSFLAVASVLDLRATLQTRLPGDWVMLRILRNGSEREVRLRLGPHPAIDAAQEPIVDDVGAERYWTTTFAPALAAPTSRGSSD